VIAAAGDQACDPHEAGHGAIHEKEAIIVDIFPSSISNYYYSDMTRTFCKHKAPQALQEIYDAVKEIQIRTLSKIKNEVDGKKLHKEVQDFFVSRGFQTCREGRELYGFFHGTGHGVGLDCHEQPRIASGGKILHSGELVTVEPGLYYPGRGAVRIEDLVVVRDDSAEVLTEYEKELVVE
jgi:Xaa-Pro aminopeptidase